MYVCVVSFLLTAFYFKTKQSVTDFLFYLLSVNIGMLLTGINSACQISVSKQVSYLRKTISNTS